MIINKMASKMWKFFILQAAFVSLKFIGIVFVGSIISSHVTTESSIIPPKYSSFSQVYVLEFQT